MRRMEWAGFELSRRALVMGILNVTPDSFSDGGQFFSTAAAVEKGRTMLAAGADIIDIGGESTRPGAPAVCADEEIARVLPVVHGLVAAGAVISIDTRNAATMAAALAAGANIINDVSGLKYDPDSARLVAARNCPVVLMHMRGTPATMDTQADYADVAAEVLAELTGTRDAALLAGVKAENIALDPGFGFAKRATQNILLLRAIGRFVELGHPVLVGVSRKRFIGEFGGEAEARKRLPGSLAAGLYALLQGAHILRVHDVAETVQGLKIWRELTCG